jgi:hypothetical protein
MLDLIISVPEKFWKAFEPSPRRRSDEPGLTQALLDSFSVPRTKQSGPAPLAPGRF